MKYFIIEPEVAGNIADSTFIDRSARPPKIAQLKYEFDGWQGDDIVESIMTFIVTDRLKQKLEAEKLSGFTLDAAEVVRSDQFKEIYPEAKLPSFFWLKVTGKAGKDDFGFDKTCLVISERVYQILRSLKSGAADFEEYEQG